jgi:hypothetical protein
MSRLQLLLGRLGTGRGDGGGRRLAGRGVDRGDGRSRRSTLRGTDRCDRGGGRSAGGSARRDLTGSLGGSSRCVLASLAGRARGAGSRRGGDRRERRCAGRNRHKAGAGAVGGRAEGSLRLLGSEAKLVQGVVVVVTETGVRVVGGLGVVVAGGRGGGAVSAGSLVLDIGTCKTSGVLAGKSGELVTLATLGNGNAVLVEPLLDLAVRPALKELVREALLGVRGLLGGRVVLLVGFLSSNVGVTTDGGDERVTVAGLGNRDATLVAPGLQIRVRPLSVEPVAGVGGGLAGLVRSGLVVGADGGEKRVASARARVGDSVVVAERLELRLGPAGGC